jgi:hypothetical protein
METLYITAPFRLNSSVTNISGLREPEVRWFDEGLQIHTIFRQNSTNSCAFLSVLSAILLLRNSTAKKHEKAKYAASKYRENTQI